MNRNPIKRLINSNKTYPLSLSDFIHFIDFGIWLKYAGIVIKEGLAKNSKPKSVKKHPKIATKMLKNKGKTKEIHRKMSVFGPIKKDKDLLM